MYADSLVVMAPSSIGLSMLIFVCSEVGLKHNINYKSAESITL